MFRRLCTFLLMLACAIAPAAFGFEGQTPADTQASAADCCGCCANHDSDTTCPQHECTAPVAPAVQRTSLTSESESIETVAPAARPLDRIARFLLASLSRENLSASSVRVRFAHVTDVAPAASVALFQAHCSLLI